MGSLSGSFTRNWTLKLSAFGVALLLWVAVRAEAPERHELSDIPIRVDIGDPQWALVGEPFPSSVTVQVGGPSRELIGMAADRPTVVIPLDAITSADTAVSLNNSWVRLQNRPGVIVEGIQPRSVRLSFEPMERITLPVTVTIAGELPADYAMAGVPEAYPPGIRISGPQSRMAGLDSVFLMPVDLAVIPASGRLSVDVDTTGLEGLSVQPRSVDVEVRLEDRVERVMSGIPIVLPPWVADGTRLEVRPATASVIVQGARSLVDRADPTLFQLVVRMESVDVPGQGEEAEFPVALEGLPLLVAGEPQQSVVTVRHLRLESTR